MALGPRKRQMLPLCFAAIIGYGFWGLDWAIQQRAQVPVWKKFLDIKGWY